MSELYRLIHAEKATYPIVLLCRVLKVARSSYYAWREGESARVGPLTGRGRHSVGAVADLVRGAVQDERRGGAVGGGADASGLLIHGSECTSVVSRWDEGHGCLLPGGVSGRRPVWCGLIWG